MQALGLVRGDHLHRVDLYLNPASRSKCAQTGPAERSCNKETAVTVSDVELSDLNNVEDPTPLARRIFHIDHGRPVIRRPAEAICRDPV